MLSFWQDYPEIQEKLVAVQALMNERLKINQSDIKEALQKFASRGGKMVRPALFFLFAGLSGTAEISQEQEERFVKIASSLEMLHAATLIHDDIIDDSPMRRGMASIESQFGKDVAVYTGDFIYTIYFELLIETMAPTPFLSRNAKSMKKILQGELIQKQSTFNPAISARRYLKAISGKTAELLSLSCLEGAYFSDADLSIQRIAKRVGLAIGLAFQIYDDILNFTIGLEEENKPVLTDVRQGIFTLPLLIARENAPEKILPYLAHPEQLTRQECLTLSELVTELGGISGAFLVANALTDKALAEIDKLPACPNREILSEVTQLLLQRKY